MTQNKEIDVYIDHIRKNLKNKIIHCHENFNIYEKEQQQIYNLIKLTITNGESNSALIIGPRGCGKTTLVKNVLNDLRQSINLEANAIVIELNGLIHTDDKLALKGCTIQMNLESAIDGKIFGTFAENLAYLLECLRSGKRETSKSLIFILEEFDLFCTHSNQTLLYNLLDMTHCSKSSICVIGLTSRLDVIELFEKRVKSRFSHRQIYLFPSDSDEDGSLESILEKVNTILSINAKTKEIGIPVSYLKQWNKHVSQLMKNTTFIGDFKKIHMLTQCQRVLNNILICFISQLNTECNQLTSENFAKIVTDYVKDTKELILESLSVLEICLIIAMKHHSEIYDNQPFNFEMIFERYNKFASINASTQTVHRNVVMKAFEHIKNLELIAPVGSSNRQQKEYEFYNLLLFPEQINTSVKQHSGIPTEVRQWANSNLT